MVYFEQTGKHRKPEETTKQKHEETPEAKPEESPKTTENKEKTPVQKTSENKQNLKPEPSVKPQTLPQTTNKQTVPQPVTQAEKKQPSPVVPQKEVNASQNAKENTKEKVTKEEKTPVVELNLPKKFTPKEETSVPDSKPETPSIPAIQQVPVETQVVITEPEKIVEKQKAPEVPLLIEMQDDYTSRPSIGGTIVKKGAKNQDNTTSSTTSIPLIRPLTTQISSEGTVKRK